MEKKAVGIIAEYNPFHLGHAWQIAESKRLSGGEKPIVCIMSGNWVQRGDCALTDKWTRARLALAGGADLVLELPVVWATASAEGFARGAVESLCAAGIVDTLVFGSESGDGTQLQRLADVMETERYRCALRAFVKEGLSFAAARQKAAQLCADDAAGLLLGSNDSLGVEYLRALKGRMNIQVIPRRGAHHDAESIETFASGAALRKLAFQGDWHTFARYTPAGTAERLQESGLAHLCHVERAILARLRQMSEADFAMLPDSGSVEGLPVRLVEAAKQARSLEEFLQRAKTKRYTYTRLRRIALRAFLHLEAPPEKPLYLRVLGANETGQILLKQMKHTTELPVLTKPAHIRHFCPEAQRLFQQECRTTDIYGLCFTSIRPGGLEYRVSPCMS